MHSFRGMNLAFKQLIQVASENRRRLDPWPLYFVNFDIKNNPALEKGCKKFVFKKFKFLKNKINLGIYQY